MAWVQLQRAPVGGQGPDQIILVLQGGPEVVVGGRKVRGQLYGAPVGGHSPVQVSLVIQGGPEVVVGRRVARVQLQGFAIFSNAAIIPTFIAAHFLQQGAQVSVVSGHLGRQTDGPPVRLLGARIVALGLQYVGQGVRGAGAGLALGVQLDGSPVGRFGFLQQHGVQLRRPAEHVRQTHVRPGTFGGKGDRLREPGTGLLEPARVGALPALVDQHLGRCRCIHVHRGQLHLRQHSVKIGHQVVFQQVYSPSAMADVILCFCTHFCKGKSTSLCWLENRVPSKSIIAPGLRRDHPFHNPMEYLHWRSRTRGETKSAPRMSPPWFS
mmetsp:Transcript_14372/g.25440  ORF Transcript_14372/g.25440 Transcript_14372/m.25440 type:complete len:324 (+) Transcript_14372:412-1383(+)